MSRSPRDTVVESTPLESADEAGSGASRGGFGVEPPESSDPSSAVIAWLVGVRTSTWMAWIIVGGCVLFTLSQLHPRLIVTSTTPAGGDMGAHVWAPAYLRDHLLPNWRLTGWTPDWYAGFPALQFYMVPPMLAIVFLDVVMPYGVAFKLVAVSGILTLPIAVWAFGRLSGMHYPAPELLAVGAVGFLFDRTYSILGGNISSTLAGEFSFSISLSLALLYLGLVASGLQTGRHRAAAAVVVALCGLTHVIPLFFAMAGTFALLVLYPSKAAVRWIATSAPVGALLAMWWLLPFWGQRAFMNDMGWEKKYPPASAGIWEEMGFWLSRLFPSETRLIAVVAAIGIVVALARRSTPALFLFVMLIVTSVGFVLAPQGRLWNERLLPFVHLCTYLLAAFGAAELVRLVSHVARREVRTAVVAAGAVGVALLGLAAVALPLRTLPFGETQADGSYRWPVPPVIGTSWPLAVSTTDTSYVPRWAEWNFRGYEGKVAWPEYRDVVLTMRNLGEQNGCGRAMWEHNNQLVDAYGTPMALMLLPMWTDGCIGSMEGLYFESSSTTPYHFLTQSSLSESPSRAQRSMPYREFDIDLGVRQLQLHGARYYMAITETAKNNALGHPDLTEVGRSGPWIIFEIADSPLVEALENEPIVLDGVHDAVHEWVPITAPWFQDPTQWDLHWASSGPEEWQRTDSPENAERRAQPLVEVTEIASGTDWIRFEVSEPGTPVLVKVSFFPNWRASGAEGPWRVTPNLMVVIPTDTTVELRYGRSTYEIAGWGLTGMGVVLLVLLSRSSPLVMPVWTHDEDRAEAPGDGDPDTDDDPDADADLDLADRGHADPDTSLIEPVTPPA